MKVLIEILVPELSLQLYSNTELIVMRPDKAESSSIVMYFIFSAGIYLCTVPPVYIDA